MVYSTYITAEGALTHDKDNEINPNLMQDLTAVDSIHLKIHVFSNFDTLLHSTGNLTQALLLMTHQIRLLSRYKKTDQPK